MGSTIERARRYYLLKRRITLDREESVMTDVWHSKQDEEPGTALPASFPFLSLLGTFYANVEDLDGADVAELTSFGLTQKQACAVLDAVAPLI